MKKIFLVRHGETEWALNGRHTGRTDIPLTANGEKQVLQLAPILQKIPFQKALVSPLKRASKTFDLLHLKVFGELDEDLFEWNYGDYEGLTSKEISEKIPNWTIFNQGASGGESIQEIQQRAARIFHKIEPCEGNILLCSSGHFLRALTTCFLGVPMSFGNQIPLTTASLSILSYEKGIPVISLWNYTEPVVF